MCKKLNVLTNNEKEGCEKKIKTMHAFYPRIINETTTKLYKNEEKFVGKGTKFNLLPDTTSIKYSKDLVSISETILIKVNSNVQQRERYEITNSIEFFLKKV